MSQSSDRRLYRHAWMVAAFWVASASWAVNTVLNFIWFGELSALNLALPVLWAALAVLFSRPYAVLNDQGMTIAVAPLRPRTLAWTELLSYEETKPGIVQLGLSNGGKVIVRLKDVRKQDQPHLRSELKARAAQTNALVADGVAG